MVKVWAEKERRNLLRLNAAGIRSPRALQLRSHVLVMEFIGTDGVAAPRLKVQLKHALWAAVCVPDHISMSASASSLPWLSCNSAACLPYLL